MEKGFSLFRKSILFIRSFPKYLCTVYIRYAERFVNTDDNFVNGFYERGMKDLRKRNI